MQEVKAITLVLKNCECISFQRSQIGVFWCDEIHSCVSRIAMNSISKHLYCKELFVELNKSADQPYETFDQMSERTAFQRLLEFQDITHIEIEYDDGTKEYIAVPWDERDDYTNLYQSCTKSKSGHLYVLVCPDKKITDVVDQEYIDDPDMADIHWDLLSE